MSAGGEPSFPAARSARQAREILSTALEYLQTMEGADLAKKAVNHAAAASSALYGAEADAQTTEAVTAGIRIAIEELTHTLSLLHSLRVQRPDSEVAATAVARTLALLYPVAQSALRQRREVIMPGAAVIAPPTIASVPPAPPPLGHPARLPGQFVGSEKRRDEARRVFVEVDIGLSSESNFYTGLSLDVSHGGVFVSTYQVCAPGTAVALYFVLPSGHAVEAQGVVRWTRSAYDDVPPGMGVAFVDLPQRDRDAISEFCSGRAPIYFDDSPE